MSEISDQPPVELYAAAIEHLRAALPDDEIVKDMTGVEAAAMANEPSYRAIVDFVWRSACDRGRHGQELDDGQRRGGL